MLKYSAYAATTVAALPLVVDQHPAGTLGADRAQGAFGVPIRSRKSRRATCGSVMKIMDSAPATWRPEQNAAMLREWTGELVGSDVWATCRGLIPASSVFAFLAEHREALFPPVMFADMHPSRNGRPSMPPQVSAAAITLQSLNGLSAHETVRELRGS